MAHRSGHDLGYQILIFNFVYTYQEYIKYCLLQLKRDRIYSDFDIQKNLPRVLQT